MFYNPFVDKDGVLIANCARGGIINEVALLDAVNIGTLTIEAQENAGIMVLELMIDYLKIGTIKNAVNEI